MSALSADTLKPNLPLCLKLESYIMTMIWLFCITILLVFLHVLSRLYFAVQCCESL